MFLLKIACPESFQFRDCKLKLITHLSVTVSKVTNFTNFYHIILPVHMTPLLYHKPWPQNLIGVKTLREINHSGYMIKKLSF